MRDIIDFCAEVMLPIGALFAAFIAAMFILIAGTDYLDCQGFAKGTGIETRWSWGCYANVDGKWVPKQYAFGDAHEVRIKDKR